MGRAGRIRFSAVEPQHADHGRPRDRSLELVLSEAVQFGITTVSEWRSDLNYSVLHSDRLRLICRPDWSFAQRGDAASGATYCMGG
jgi:DNA-binding transcriptional LysR family regulator